MIYVYSNHKRQYSYSSVVLDNIHQLGSCSQIKFPIAKKKKRVRFEILQNQINRPKWM